MQTTSRSRSSRLAPFGILMPVWVLGLATALGLANPAYDPLRNAISELGAQGMPSALAWQLAGFGIGAVLQLVWSVAVRDAFGRGWLFALTALTAACLAAMSAARCDAGCPPVPQSPGMAVHTVAGLLLFAACFALPIAGWRTFRRRADWAGLARSSLVVGLVLVVGFLAGPALGPERLGLWQRAYLGVYSAWQVVVALRVAGWARGARRTPADARVAP